MQELKYTDSQRIRRGKMGSLSNVFDWDFFWGVFGFFLKTISPFIMLVVAIIAVGLLIRAVISAIKARSG